MFEECEFKVSGYTLKGRLYGKTNQSVPGCQSIIALHGWLDNCGSFATLAPKLQAANCCVLALDLPGHGQSDHRNFAGAYNIWQDIPEILMVAEQLQWPKFGLVGHSRGAMISTMMAALVPDKVNFLGLIDGITPIPAKDDNILDQLELAVQGALSIQQRPRGIYESFEAAVKARENGFMPLSTQDASMLAERGVLKDENGYYWASDKKLLIPSEIKFTEKQLRDFMNKIKLDIHLVLGEEGLLGDFAYILEWLKAYSKVQIHRFPGGHHLHMSQATDKVAKTLIDALPKKHN